MTNHQIMTTATPSRTQARSKRLTVRAVTSPDIVDALTKEELEFYRGFLRLQVDCLDFDAMRQAVHEFFFGPNRARLLGQVTGRFRR